MKTKHLFRYLPLAAALTLSLVACNEDDPGDDITVIEGVDLRAEYDGKVVEIQHATKGNGINIVMMGDGYTPLDIDNGTYDEVMRKAASYLFLLQPMKSLQEYFNVYYITCASMNSSLDGQTAMGCLVIDNGVNGSPSGSIMTQKAMAYLKNLPNFDRNNTIASVVLNSYDYGGVTYYPFHAGETANYDEMLSVAYTSYHEDGIDGTKFKNVIQHETIGHGFAKLADEYTYTGTSYATAPAAYTRLVSSFYWPHYWYYNISGTGTATATHLWTPFLNEQAYAAEQLGFYQGANYYQTGYYRASDASIMRTTEPEDVIFNAPSRYAIYLHTMRIGEGRIPTVEEFIAFDKQHQD